MKKNLINWWSLGSLATLAAGCPDVFENPPPLEAESEASSTSGSSGDTTTASDATSGSSGTTQAVDTTETPDTTDTTAALDTTAADSTGPTIVCGDGTVEEGEDCDGSDWQGATCESLGQAAGTLACTDACTFDITGCVPPGMVLIPGGEFEMGSNLLPGEMPIRQVHVDAFWVDETEVTVEEYSACVAAGACSQPAVDPVPYCNWGQPGREDHPINCVDWYQAVAYCEWVDGGTNRLPTEAEWEKAARGTDARMYPWGDAPGPTCTHVVMHDDFGMASAGCGNDSSMPVGSKPLGDSPYGVKDLSGNVWEWVADWYGPYDAAETDNPTGAVTGTARVVRGDSWYSAILDYFRAANRGSIDPVNRWMIVGFRCARTPMAVP